MIISGDSKTSITVVWGTQSGDVSVKGVNDCGEGALSNLQVDVMLGIGGNDKPFIGITPNPATDLVYLTGLADALEINFFDAFGKCVLTTQAERGKAVIDVYDIPAGIYVVQAGHARGVLIISR
jgi:hypothetical protein